MNKENTEDNEIQNYIFSFVPKISSGLDHYACVGYLKNKPTVYCWGGNSCNQLGVGINTRYCKRPTAVSFFEDFYVSSVCCTYYCTHVLAKKNASDVGCSVYSFGKGNNGLLGFRKKRNLIPLQEEDIHLNEKNKHMRKFNNKANKTLLDAFGINQKKKESFSSGNVDSLLDFDVSQISSSPDEDDQGSATETSADGRRSRTDTSADGRRSKTDTSADGRRSKTDTSADGRRSRNDTSTDGHPHFDPVTKKHISKQKEQGEEETVPDNTREGEKKGRQKMEEHKEKNKTRAKRMKNENYYKVRNDLKEEKEDWFTPMPIKVKFPERVKIKFISCGDMHTLAISTNGILYGWGYNNFGCVGNGCNKNVYEPVRIFFRKRRLHSDEGKMVINNTEYGKSNKLRKYHGSSSPFLDEHKEDVVIHCSAGGKHSLACTLQGDMYSWGYGGNGRLGLGNIRSYNKPQLIRRLQNRKRIIYVCSGKSHSGCIDADYNVYTWGNGKFFKLGHGDDNDVLVPKFVEFLTCSNKIFMLSFGTFNSLALSVKGDVFIWGSFTLKNKKTGSSSYTSKIPKMINSNYKCISVHASIYIVLAITIVGDLIMLGDTDEALVGRGHNSYFNVVGENNHNSESDSEDSNAQVLNQMIRKEKKSSINYYASLKNEFPIRYVKELRGKVHVKDILNLFYKLEKFNSYPGDYTYQQVYHHNHMQRLNDASYYDIEGIQKGVEPYGILRKNQLVIRSKVKMIEGSEHFSMFLLQSGKVYASGFNKDGELGNGENNLKKKFATPVLIEICVNKIVKIACGYNYTLVLSDKGFIYGWGKNDKSQLGIGVLKDTYEPVHLKSMSKVIDIYAGHDHSACIVNSSFEEVDTEKVDNEEDVDDIPPLQHGILYTWGNAESGKVGLGVDYTHGSILLPRRINTTNKIHKCSLGINHSLFLSDSNELYACGSANNGKLGIIDEKMNYMVCSPRRVNIDPNIYIKEIIAGSTFSIILSTDGYIYIWGEFIKNRISYEYPTMYTEIINVKHIIGGRDKHIFFLTYDNKLFGLGNNTYMQILHEQKETSIYEKPKLISYFLDGNVIESAYSFKNASFVQLAKNHDIFAWGYTSNCHLGIGLTNVTYLKHPKKVVRSWVTYEDCENGESGEYAAEANIGNLINSLNPTAASNMREELLDEFQLVRKRILKRDRFENDLVYAIPYYQEEIEKLIYQIQIMPQYLNWEYIQVLLKRENYTNSIGFIRSFEKDLIDIYKKHVKFLLNLHSFERQYNDLHLNYQNYVLANISMLEEERPSIMYSNYTHVLDNNRDKLQSFVYILQQQPLYLTLLCLIHNSKNVKHIKRMSYLFHMGREPNALISASGGASIYVAAPAGEDELANDKGIKFAQSRAKNHFEFVRSYLNHIYDYDSYNVVSRCRQNCHEYENQKTEKIREKYNFYRNSTFILCSFIFDLYYDLRNDRIRNIFTIFLIKLGIEEINNCLHIESLFRIETSVFFLLIKMLFMKNDILVSFAHSLADMTNPNSFVRLLDGLSHCVREDVASRLEFPESVVPKREDLIMKEAHESMATKMTDSNMILENTLPRNAPVKNTSLKGRVDHITNDLGKDSYRNRFIEEEDTQMEKEFLKFIKGKTQEKTDSVNLTGQHLQKDEDDSLGFYNNFDEHMKEYPLSASPVVEVDKYRNESIASRRGNPKDVLIEVDMVHVFREMCKLFRKIQFPEMFKIIIKNVFKYFCIYERNVNKESMLENKIFYFNNEHFVYVPFYHLLLMAILNPMITSMNKMAEKFYFPLIPSHITSICDRISNFIEVLYLNKYESLASYNLKENLVSVKFIFENTFNVLVQITNNLCKTDEDVYLNVYINLFHYHLCSIPSYVNLKLFQLCHVFNLFFRFQNYLSLSFSDPLIDIVNFFYKRKADSTGAWDEAGTEKNGTEKNGTDKNGTDKNGRGKNGKSKNGKSKNGKSKNTIQKFLLKSSGGDSDGSDGRAKERIKKRSTNRTDGNGKKKKKLIFSESEINLFVKCKLVYSIELDIRFLIKEKNMSICEFTRIPMPQYMCYRKKTRIKNNEYLFSIIEEFKHKKDKIFVVCECLRGCPMLENCTETSNLILKLRSLRTYFMSLDNQKETNLVHLIDKTVEILLSNEMSYVDFVENLPPNLYTHKFKNEQIEKTRREKEYLHMLQNSYDKHSFFQNKWRNIAMQICLNMLEKKKHVNYLKKLHERQEKIEQLIFAYQFKLKNNIQIIKRALIFVSKLLIEKPILIHATHFQKNLFFIKLKRDKDFRRTQRNNYLITYNTSTVHIYPMIKLIQNGSITNINEIIHPLVDFLSIELSFDIDLVLKLNLVLIKGAEKKIINSHTFRSQDIYNIYNHSPFISYPLFPYNKDNLCAIRGLSFVHLLHDLVVDLF
ncbi:guanidine nucleotide exchange factor [Plasmodium gonderi]|uniref:Guanidine nucleotide exchange factor n=1 Tax=Plasmodium gonderi TaxID=77519 RepID=A0A1Y1JGU5_PLAGO|nr:guanidine nucleotide exchange factor [Plasmodium gonderi]GAW81470.1 guanidine nucleotide exchange factor [Plasmodium gonderi]